MIQFFVVVSVLSLAASILLALELRRTSNIYESIFTLLSADRDAAREESAKLKLVVFPQLAKITEAKPKAETPKVPNDPVKNLLNSRLPFRIKARLLTKATNTSQLGRDRMAQAITPQPAAKETSNV